MRSGMAWELAEAHGIEWYPRTDLLDEETLKLIDAAWRVGRLGQLTGSLDVECQGLLDVPAWASKAKDGAQAVDV